MITTWTTFLIIAITVILAVLVLLFLLLRKMKVKAKISVPIVLVFGLVFGGGAFGYLTAVHGSHFVVLKSNLEVEKYYSIGVNDYVRENGETYTIEKMQNVLINDTGRELVYEKVVYGYGSEPEAEIVEIGAVHEIKLLPTSIYYFDDEPPTSVTSENSSVTKYWVYLYE